jgi:hypothetical protein
VKSVKTTFKIAIVVTSILLGKEVNAQCKNFVKKADFSVMKAYECKGLQVAEMYGGDEAQIPITMEDAKRYRIMASAQDHMGKLELSITNGEGKEIGIEVNEEQQTYYEVMVSEKQAVNIDLKVVRGKNKARLNTSGCVALAIGEMDNIEMVSK